MQSIWQKFCILDFVKLAITCENFIKFLFLHFKNKNKNKYIYDRQINRQIEQKILKFFNIKHP